MTQDLHYRYCLNVIVSNIKDVMISKVMSCTCNVLHVALHELVDCISFYLTGQSTDLTN